MIKPITGSSEAGDNWIEAEVGAAKCQDARLSQRLMLILKTMFESSQKSIKAACGGWAEVIGAYRFFNNQRVTAEVILAPHQEATRRRVQEQRRVLVIQDTSELDYSSQKELRGTGPLNCENRRGFLFHTQYVVSEEAIPLGIWGSLVFARDEEGAGPEGSAGRKQKPIEEKESVRWLEGYRQACELQQQTPGVSVVSCSDREGDIYEIFEEWQCRRERAEPVADWLIRSCQDRCISRLDSQLSEGAGNQKIRDQVRQGPVLGEVVLEIKSKQGTKKVKGNTVPSRRTGRRVRQQIRAAQVTLKAPFRTGEKLPPVTIWAVLAQEINPPAGEDPIEWLLLTSLEVKDLQNAVEVIRLYTLRWEIEVFHRVLKSGCRVEELQLKESARLKPALALYMMVAWRILYLMKIGRQCPDLPCDVLFEEAEWKAVCMIVTGQLKKPTWAELLQMIASLGGHLGRKGDGQAGPEALWIGLTRVKDFALAWLAFGQNNPLVAGATCV